MRPLLITGAAVLALGISGLAVPASATTSAGRDIVVGQFFGTPRGVSTFRSSGTSSVRVVGAYRNLKPNASYFTVVYGNGNCDPAQALPVGPFVTNKKGRGSIRKTVALPMGVNLGSSGSVSVRIGDDATDQDKDGITGPGDVVAVAGSPSIGLVQCDTNPRTVDR